VGRRRSASSAPRHHHLPAAPGTQEGQGKAGAVYAIRNRPRLPIGNHLKRGPGRKGGSHSSPQDNEESCRCRIVAKDRPAMTSEPGQAQVNKGLHKCRASIVRSMALRVSSESANIWGSFISHLSEERKAFDPVNVKPGTQKVRYCQRRRPNSSA